LPIGPKVSNNTYVQWMRGRSSDLTVPVFNVLPILSTTLCCDSSPNRHAAKHARASKHSVIASAEPGERWLYCYPDDQTTEH
jgi:Zn-finger in ubiquitin-hydrolases and other protein